MTRHWTKQNIDLLRNIYNLQNESLVNRYYYGMRLQSAQKVAFWMEISVAVTASGSIGYAAYYAATREYPDRYVTLRHKSSIVSRWNGPDS